MASTPPPHPDDASAANAPEPDRRLADALADERVLAGGGRWLQEVFGEIQRAVAAAIRAPCFALLTVDRAQERFRPQLLIVDGVVTRERALAPVAMHDGLPATRAWRDGDVTMAANPPLTWAAIIPGSARGRAARSEIAAPILFGETRLGVLVVQAFEPGAFALADADLLALIGRQAGIVLDNARLVEAQRRERAFGDAAIAIAHAGLTHGSVGEAAQAILAAVDGVLPAVGKSLAFGHDEIHPTPHAPSLAPTAPPAPGPALPFAALVSGGVRHHAVSGTPPGEDALVIPLVSRKRTIGVLAIGGRPLDDHERELCERLAPPIALAITAQLAAERERRRRDREGMLATALATMDHPVFILSRERRVLYANPSAVREYGWSAEELAGRTVELLTTSAFPAARVEDERGAPVAMTEQMHRRRDGSHFPVAVALSEIRQTGGSPVGWVLSVRNLTDERRINEQLRQSEKLATMGQLVAGVAHELNNPLAGISAFAQIMMDEDLRPDQHESVLLIKREADRASSVIKDLLAFSRKSSAAIRPVDINALVQFVLRLRSYALQASGIDVRTELDAANPVVEGDDPKLQQVVLNLLLNAEDAMRSAATKRLLVRTQHGADARLGEVVTIEVGDTGSGMSDETRERIFEPFFTTKPAGSGTGLGLSLSYGIVEAHGGSIGVESELGRGTTFRITLPLRRGTLSNGGHAQRSA